MKCSSGSDNFSHVLRRSRSALTISIERGICDLRSRPGHLARHAGVHAVHHTSVNPPTSHFLNLITKSLHHAAALLLRFCLLWLCLLWSRRGLRCDHCAGSTFPIHILRWTLCVRSGAAERRAFTYKPLRAQLVAASAVKALNLAHGKSRFHFPRLKDVPFVYSARFDNVAQSSFAAMDDRVV
jgi:hypothetical protein